MARHLKKKLLFYILLGSRPKKGYFSTHFWGLGSSHFGFGVGVCCRVLEPFTSILKFVLLSVVAGEIGLGV